MQQRIKVHPVSRGFTSVGLCIACVFSSCSILASLAKRAMGSAGSKRRHNRQTSKAPFLERSWNSTLAAFHFRIGGAEPLEECRQHPVSAGRARSSQQISHLEHPRPKSLLQPRPHLSEFSHLRSGVSGAERHWMRAVVCA